MALTSCVTACTHSLWAWTAMWRRVWLIFIMLIGDELLLLRTCVRIFPGAERILTVVVTYLTWLLSAMDYSTVIWAWVAIFQTPAQALGSTLKYATPAEVKSRLLQWCYWCYISVMTPQITGDSTVCRCPLKNHGTCRLSALLAIFSGIHWWQMDSPHIGPAIRNAFLCHGAILYFVTSCTYWDYYSHNFSTYQVLVPWQMVYGFNAMYHLFSIYIYICMYDARCYMSLLNLNKIYCNERNLKILWISNCFFTEL